MSKRIADLTPAQLQQGILNLDGQLEAADDAVREAADRRAELGAGSVDALEALLAIKAQEIGAAS